MESFLKIFGGVIIAIGLVAGSIYGVNDNKMLLMFLLPGLTSGVFFIGLGDIIAYLHKIYLSLEPKQKENIKSEIK